MSVISRRLADGAAAALEADVGDAVVRVHREIDLHPVAAQWIEALTGMRRAWQPAEMARVLGVIEDNFLIELAQIVVHDLTQYLPRLVERCDQRIHVGAHIVEREGGARRRSHAKTLH
jgi:hypothetical protein